MRDEAWRKAQELLNEARDLGAQSSQALVAGLQDSGLRARMEGRIAGGGTPADTTQVGAGAAPGEGFGTLDLGTGLAPGERAGAYEIEALIGSGGMGHVYRARRADGAFERRVAVKVLKRGLDTDEILRRFQRERRALAALDHPCIAPLLDAGALADGRPYLVLELVEGQPIDRYADEHRLSIEQRLRLFLRVCDAVDTAHRRLIIHRDLKPANILVATDGTPKLLDFGIAKLLDEEDSDPLTRVPLDTPLTLGYASPEQVRGEPTTTATDVYALGVVLYELLTGHAPYRVLTRLRSEAERVICEEEPARPSVVIGRTERLRSAAGGVARVISPESVSAPREGTPERLRRRLRGDLDAVLLRALAKSPATRTATVAELAEDLRRILTGLPVRARAGGAFYRLSKLVRRHRLLLGSGTLLVSIAASAAVSVAWQARVAARERDEAVAARRGLERIEGFLTEMLRAPDPGQGARDVTVREVLDRAVARVGADLGDTPAVEATVRNTLGQTYQSLGKYPEAEAQYRAALALREASSAPSLDLAIVASNLGTVLYAQGRHAEAARALARAVELAERAGVSARAELAQALNNVAAVWLRLGDLASARVAHERALALRRELHGPRSLEAAESLNNLSNLFRHLGEEQRVRELLGESLSIRTELLDADHPLLAQSRANYAVLEMRAGNLEAAEPLLEMAAASSRRRLGNDHPDLAHVLGHQADLERLRGRPERAEPLIREALAVRRAALGEAHPSTVYNHAQLGECLLLQARDAEGVEVLEIALPVLSARMGPDHARVRAMTELLSKARSRLDGVQGEVEVRAE